MQRASTAVLTVLFLVQVAFASWAIVGKVTLGAVPPTTLVFFRLAGAALFFSVWSALRGRPLLPPPELRGAIFRLALSGLVLNQLFFTFGMRSTSAVETALLTATIPVLSVAFAVLTGREPTRKSTWLGAFIALSGVVLVARPARLSLTDAHLLGDLLVLANVSCYALYLVWAREVIAKHGALQVIAWAFLFAAALVTPFAVPEVLSVAPAFSLRVWLACAYVVLVPTIFTYGANAWALGRAPSSLVALFIYLQPAMAIAMAVGFGDSLARWLGVPAPNEHLTAGALAGSALILAGVTVATRGK